MGKSHIAARAFWELSERRREGLWGVEVCWLVELLSFGDEGCFI